MSKINQVKDAIQRHQRKRFQQLLCQEFEIPIKEARKHVRQVLKAKTKGPIFLGFQIDKGARQELLNLLQKSNLAH